MLNLNVSLSYILHESSLLTCIALASHATILGSTPSTRTAGTRIQGIRNREDVRTYVLAIILSADFSPRLSTVKGHKANVLAKEREVLARESAFAAKEAQMAALLSQKNAEIDTLQLLVAQARESSNEAMDARIRDAVSKREEELRIAVMRREEEVAAAMMRREEEILGAVRKREREIFEMWTDREEQIRLEMAAAVEERVQWAVKRAEELKGEEDRISKMAEELEAKLQLLANAETKGQFVL